MKDLKQLLYFVFITVGIFSCSTDTEEVLPNDSDDVEVNLPEEENDNEGDYETIVESGVSFVTIPEGGDVASFRMSQSEVTNEQYTQFLNEALLANKITYDVTQQIVYDLAQNPMINIGGTRVIKDHNKDGVYELDEMENPLNRCFIAFNEDTQQFYIVDPASVDWKQYFDTSVYPNAVDTIEDWAELNDQGTGFYEEPDADKQLPTVEEVAQWPVNHMRYYGAEGFAKFYGFDLPTKAQWRHAGQGGKGFDYATSDGNVSTSVAWYNPTSPQTIWKGHAQMVMSKNPNPYGVYDLGGSIWEWCKDWYNGYTIFGGASKEDKDFFIDDTISYEESVNKYLKCILGGSFNFFSETMNTTWNHAALPYAGNDHFGFRVVKND